MDVTVWNGIIIGGVGGAIAGVAVWLLNFLTEKITESRHKKRIYDYLYDKTKKDSIKWRSNREIASYNNLTEDRVRYICSIHERIVLSQSVITSGRFGEEIEAREDIWAIKEFIMKQREEMGR